MSTKRAVALTAYNRPRYLAQALDSLSRNNCEGYTLHIGLEPGNQDVYQLCTRPRHIPTVVHRNVSRLGVRANPYNLLRTIFDSGVDNVLYAEDDLVLSPDATALSNWYFSTFPQGSYLALGLFNYSSDDKQRHGAPTAIYSSKKFSALGLALDRSAWEQWFKPYWFNDDLWKLYGEYHVGWDWSITGLLRHVPGLRTLIPALSRSNHIGREGGVHCTPDYHDQTFPRVVWNQDSTLTNYVFAGPLPGE